jgi:hypothetical protein
MGDMPRRLIPKLTHLLLRAARSKVSSETRSEVIKIFQEYRCVGLTIDGVTINSGYFVSVKVVHPLSRTQPFTFDFLAESSYRTREFVWQFAGTLVTMLRQRLNVAGVTSDGCTFQEKGFTWQDKESIQANYEEFTQIILLSCIGHRPQNSLKHLHRCHQHDRDSINEVREMNLVLRKPRSRAERNAMCPAHCVTRWVHDFEIVKLIGDHLE